MIQDAINKALTATLIIAIILVVCCNLALKQKGYSVTLTFGNDTPDARLNLSALQAANRAFR